MGGSETLGAKEICQIAIVVRDIEKAAARYAEVFGLPRAEIRSTAPEAETHIRYRGAPTPGQAKLAFFKMGALSLELIEPLGGPSTWQEHLDRSGEGVHHIAFRVPEMGPAVAYLNGQGIPTVQSGDFKGGCYVYLDALKDLKVTLELLAKQ